MTAYLMGVLSTVIALFIMVKVVPVLAIAGERAMSRSRLHRAFYLEVLSAYIRRVRKRGPQLRIATRQAERRVRREMMWASLESPVHGMRRRLTSRGIRLPRRWR